MKREGGCVATSRFSDVSRDFRVFFLGWGLFVYVGKSHLLGARAGRVFDFLVLGSVK